MSEAILIASYGARAVQGRLPGLELLQKEISERTSLPVAQAYFHKALIAERPETSLESQMKCLLQYAPEKLTVLPTFLTQGKTWTAFQEQISGYKAQFREVRILPTVLEPGSNREALARLLTALPGLDKHRRCLFVGHGAGDETDGLYLDMEKRLQAQGFANVNFALLHGTPDTADVLRTWSSDGRQSVEVLVVPFLVSSGRHMTTDIFGNSAGSISNILRSAGYWPELLPLSLLDYSVFRSYLSQLCISAVSL